ncbi:MAG: hypothetical protein LBG58_01105, partial [Planctomycetaceae bacterium]|nr:hypothetical protein [Planctomycetaceae bacterium]
QHCVPTGRGSFCYTVFYQDVVPNGTGIFGKTTKPLNRYNRILKCDEYISSLTGHGMVLQLYRQCVKLLPLIGLYLLGYRSSLFQPQFVSKEKNQ